MNALFLGVGMRSKTSPRPTAVVPTLCAEPMSIWANEMPWRKVPLKH